MLNKKSIRFFREFSKDWPDVDYSRKSDAEVSKIAEEWLKRKPRRYTRRKPTKLFYYAVARIKIAKPDYVALMVLKQRFNIGFIRAGSLHQELEDAGIIRKIDSEKAKPNINWDIVRETKIPKQIMEEARKMKPTKIQKGKDLYVQLQTKH